MQVSVVLNATDPARLADIVRALGLRVDEPNRPNPNTWTADLEVSLVITQAAPGEPFVSLGVRDHDAAQRRLVDLLGDSAIAADRDGAVLHVNGPDGLRIDIAKDAPWKQLHDVWDVGYLYAVMPRFTKNRERVMSALQAVGASNPRLAGPNLSKLKNVQWWLVVDGPEDMALEPAQQLLDDLQTNPQRVQLKRASDIDPELLDAINKKAFDI